MHSISISEPRCYRRERMRSWKTLIGTLMLVLMMWTGGLAQAAEREICMPATTESAGHYEGDRDQRPADREQGAAHHHSGCSGHQLAASAEEPGMIAKLVSGPAPLERSKTGLYGHDPDGRLRPPIA